MTEIEEKLDRCERELSYASSILDDVKDILSLPNEVKEFLLDLSVDESIPDNIRRKADELWKIIA